MQPVNNSYAGTLGGGIGAQTQNNFMPRAKATELDDDLDDMMDNMGLGGKGKPDEMDDFFGGNKK